MGQAPSSAIVASALRRHHQLDLVAVTEAGGAAKGASGRQAPSLRRGLEPAAGGVAVICAGPTLDDVEGPLFAAIDAGLHVVALCDELVHPWFSDPDLAERIDDRAAARGVAVLGIGATFGGILDRLAATLGGATGALRGVVGGRVVGWDDASDEALLRRAGVGTTEDAFERGVDGGTIGVVGLSESCALVAEGLDLSIDEVEETIDPIVAQQPIQVGKVTIPAGSVQGLRQVARGFDEGREVVRLSFEVGPSLESKAWVRLEGAPDLELALPGGISEEAIGWTVANAIPTVVQSDPGLLSVLDLPAGR